LKFYLRHYNKGFGFVEFAAMEDAESALMFDGIAFKVGRCRLTLSNLR